MGVENQILLQFELKGREIENDQGDRGLLRCIAVCA